MIDIKRRFLELAVLDQVKYSAIEKELKVEREKLSKWWDELKDERESWSKIRRIWKTKFVNTEDNSSFYEFKEWYEQTKEECHYCGITQAEITRLFTKDKSLTKRNRGRKLEIDRKMPNEHYDNIKNLVYSCYWCNNAKTDTFSAIEFETIGKEIGKIWKLRLKKI